MPYKSESWISKALNGSDVKGARTAYGAQAMVDQMSNNWSKLLGGASKSADSAYAIGGGTGTSMSYVTVSNANIWYSQMMYSQMMNNNHNQMISILGLGCQPPESAEEKAARFEAAEKRKIAEARAEQLMFTILKPEQVRQYRDHGYFETHVNERIYRIKKERSQNIEQIEKGKPILRLCAHPSEWMPDADNMVSQLLMLRTDEKKFLEIANRTRLAA
jgi:hypothetical protein